MNLEHASIEILSAISVMQGQLVNVAKTSDNPFYKSKYADLAAVLNALRPHLAANGLGIIQSPAYDGVQCHVTTAITHSGGGYVTTTMSCVPAKTDAQGIGAATTYLRRYSLAAICGLAQEDDDGNSAAHPNQPHPLITDSQGKWIAEKISNFDIDLEAFLKHYGVKSISSITTDKIDAIKKAFANKQKTIEK